MSAAMWVMSTKPSALQSRVAQRSVELRQQPPRGPVTFTGAGFPQQLLVSPGLSQHSENNTSWLGYRGRGQIGSEFFEISKYLQKIILVGRCEKSLSGGTFPAELKLELFKGN